MSSKIVNQFLANITQWVAVRSDIQALALVGSHARGTASESSDIDLVLITSRPNEYLNHTNWTLEFGVIEKKQIENYGLVVSIRVWYASGLEIEFGITDRRWAALPIDAGTKQVMADGMRILFERGSILSRHLSP